MLSPAAAAIKSALAALAAGKSESDGAMTQAELRETLGYPAYEAAAKPYTL
jgi:hypothetical protein